MHRDVKPANVLVTTENGADHAYLTDFGLTKKHGSTSVTATGAWMGTLDYIAPEQITGEQVDARTDIYALGCMLFKLLTGQVPFPRETDAEKLWAHMNAPAPAPSDLRDDLPRGFDNVVRTTLSKDPAKRYASAGELGAAADVALEGRRPPAPRRGAARRAFAPTRAVERLPRSGTWTNQGPDAPRSLVPLGVPAAPPV